MPAREVRTSRLTTEEWAALSLSATGLTVTEVAVALDASPEAVREALASAVRKLGARSKLEAVWLALQTGEIRPTPTAREQRRQGVREWHSR